jgi:hypothetical protein
MSTDPLDVIFSTEGDLDALSIGEDITGDCCCCCCCCACFGCKTGERL